MGEDKPASSEKASSSTLKWWQWIFAYPALAIALAGYIPSVLKWYEARQINVTSADLDAAKRRNKLYEKNFDCTRTLTFQTVTTPYETNVSVGVCPSGDILIVLQSEGPQKTDIKEWISIDEIKKRQVSVWMQEALAAEADHSFLAQGQQSTICSRWVGPGLLLMRLHHPNGQCFDQTVNTYTGIVVNTVPAPCNPNC